MQPYACYKPSGVAWLGNIPAHWHVGRLKFSATAHTSNVDKHTKDDEVPSGSAITSMFTTTNLSQAIFRLCKRLLLEER